MPNSLWPDFPAESKPRGMRQMLEEAGGDIGQKTRDVVEFRVKVYPDGNKFIHDCYLVAPRVGYQHLLVRVITMAKPFPATVVPPDGPSRADIADEKHLRFVLEELFKSQETRDVVENLIANFATSTE